MMRSRILAALWLAAAAGAAHAQVSSPITVDADILGRYFVVQGQIEGKPVRLIVDSGAGLSVLTPDAAKRLGVPEGRPIRAGGAGEKPVEARLTRVATMSVGAAKVENVDMIVVDLPPVLDCDGLVGFSFLKNFAVTFDYQRPSMTLVPGGNALSESDGKSVAMKLRGNIPTFPGKLDGIEGWYSLDTGANGTLTLMTPFVESNQLASRYPKRTSRIVGKGVGGYVSGETVRLKSIDIGGIDLRDVPASFSTTRSGALAAPGLIGNVGAEILSKFVVTLDYPAGRIRFAKSPDFGKPYTVDRAGMFVDFNDGKATVVEVVAKGPAQEAGLAVGDVIVQVEGKAVGSVHPLELGKVFRGEAGRKVSVTVSRVGKERTAVLVLRDLV